MDFDEIYMCVKFPLNLGPYIALKALGYNAEYLFLELYVAMYGSIFGDGVLLY